jgi:hypothetical protein
MSSPGWLPGPRDQWSGKPNGRPELRIGDAEREGAAWALGEHYAAGRLTKEEYDERAGAAWKARTHSELAPLFGDLPVPHGRPSQVDRHQPGPGPVPRLNAARPPAHRHGSRFPWMVLLVALVVLAAMELLPWFVVVAAVIFVVARSSHRHSHSRGHRRR